MKNLFLATVATLAFSGCAGVTGQRAWFIAHKKSPVCKAFFSGEPINARSVTNYYVDASDEFFATVIDAKIVGNKGFEIKNLDFKFNLPSSKLAEAKEQATSEKFRQDVIEQDVKKQGRILLNILCYYSMPSK